ncbi:LPG20, partial [[Candida] subhashii]
LKKYNIPRDRVVILSKCFGPVDEENPTFGLFTQNQFPAIDYYNSQGLSRKHIFDAVQNSQRRLGTYIDVLQIHRLDPTTPKKEIMKALNDVVDQGYARYIGASSMKAVEFAELQYIAHANNWHKFISMQNYYNLIYREEEREMIPFCQKNELGEVGIIPWSPIARGILARPVGKESENKRDIKDKGITRLHLNELTKPEEEIIGRIQTLAKKYNVSMAALATSWVIGKKCNPIVGLSSVDRVDDILTATTIQLTEEDVKFLEDPYVANAAMF